MHVISGQRCAALYKKSGPLGSLVRTLLASPQWSKEGYSLTWEAKKLFSRRVQEFTDTNFSKPSPLNESAVTLSTSDIPSSRCLFQLRLSELPTEETESLSLPMLQTPTAVMTCEDPEKMRERAKRNGYKNGTKYGSLETQINYDPRFKGLLKTPSTFDAASERMESRGISGTSGTLAQEIQSGYVAKRGLILPTPTAGEAEKYRLRYTPGSQMGTSLSAMAGSGLLPTPTARDEKNPSSPDGKRIARKIEKGYTIELNDLAAMGSLPTPDSSQKTAGGAFRLSPLFTEEMMGFPLMWTALPFLQYPLPQPMEKETPKNTHFPNGEPKPSKPTETPSSRK